MSDVIREECRSVSLTRKPKCQKWYLCFRVKRFKEDGKGKWATKWQSTGTDDREEAERDWLRPALDLIGDRKHREAQAKLLEIVTGVNPSNVRVRLDGLWEFYLQHGTVSGSARQVRNRAAMFRYFLAWLQQHHPAAEYLREVTIRIAGAFWRWMEDDGKSPRTRNKYRNQLGLVWQGVTVAAELTLNPWEKLETDKGGGERLQDFSLEQVHRLLEAAETFPSAWPGFWACAIRMGAETGLRSGDIATLEADEVHRDTGYLVLVPNKGRRWGKDRVAVHSLDRPWVDLLPAVDQGEFWPGPARISRNGEGDLGEEFRKICESAGIEVERETEEGERRKRKIRLYSFHSLRHAFATMALDTGTITEKDLVAQGNWAGEEVIRGHYDHRDKLSLAMAAADKVAKALPKW